MGCCGGQGGHGRGTGGDKGAGGINWVQIVALGMIALLVAGFVLGR